MTHIIISNNPLLETNFQLDPAGWLPKFFVNRLNTKLVMIIGKLKKLAQAYPDKDDLWLPFDLL